MFRRASSLFCGVLLLLPCAAMPVSAIRAQAGAPPSPGDHWSVINVGGLARRYLLHVPPAYTGAQPTPLVLVFHGGGGNGVPAAQRFGFSELADRRGFLVAYPEGIDGWNDGRDNPSQQYDDVGFVRALLGELKRTLNVDARRVFATGGSNGALFSQRLACELSDQFAAIAPVSGTMAERLAPQCAPAYPISVVEFHGKADRLVPYSGGGAGRGGRGRSVVPSVARGVRPDGCLAPPQIAAEPGRDPHEGPRVRREAYAVGSNRGVGSVVLYAIQGGGHAWPNVAVSDPLSGPVCRDINATQIIWDFFAQHPKPEARRMPGPAKNEPERKE